MKKILLLFLFLLVIPSTTGNTAKGAIPQHHENWIHQDTNQLLLNYAKLLSDDAREHREYLQSNNKLFIAVITGIAAIWGSFLTFFNIKSKKDIIAMVNERFNNQIDNEIKHRLKKHEDKINSDFERITYDFESRIKELTHGLARMMLDVTRQIPSGERPVAPDLIDEANLRNKKVLWVDDKPKNNLFPINILKAVGISFTTASSTDEAIGILMTLNFDLVITNIGRGHDNEAGITLLREIKEKDCSVPVIIFTRPKTLITYQQKALKLGANKCVTGYVDIIKEVQTLLGK